MVDIAADDVAGVRSRAKVAWRTLAVLALLGMSLPQSRISPALTEVRTASAAHLYLGQSLLGGCDWLE